VRDIIGLVEKMEYMINHPEISQRMGAQSLKIAQEKYDVKIVNKTIMQTMELF
jgi:hypothetical protein